jgi:hypothetical protein
MSYFQSAEYNAIKEFYGDRTAKRSGVPLINHIHEGVRVMELFCASEAAIRAYMLHPLFQNNDELETVGVNFANRNSEADPFVVMLAMEYRARANDWLANKVYQLEFGGLGFKGKPSAGAIREVKHMLIADKIQNRKDFELYHKSTHERSKELDMYFKIWLGTLGVNEERYQAIKEILQAHSED